MTGRATVDEVRVSSSLSSVIHYVLISCLNFCFSAVISLSPAFPCSIPLRVCLPTHTEMDSNLDHAFQNMPKSSGEIHGVQIGADELKLECHMHWEPCKNVILDICHEHSERFGLELHSMAQAYALRDGIQNGFIHLASEVSFTFEWYFFSSNMHLRQQCLL